MALSRNRRLALGGLVLLVLLVVGLGAGWVLYKRRHAPRELTPPEAYTKGKKLLEEQNLVDAFQHLEYAAQKMPDNLDAQWEAARVSLQLHRRDFALPHLRLVWNGGRKTRDVFLALVDATPFQSPQELLKTGLEWLKDLPDGPDRRDLEAEVYFAAQNPAEALRRWNEDFATSPTSLVATRIAMAQVALGKPSEAASFLDPLRKTLRLDAGGYALLATLRAQMDDRTAAAEVFEEGKRAFPENEDLRFHEATYLVSEDKGTEAMARLETLKNRGGDPATEMRHHHARILLGFIHAGRGEMTALSVLESSATGDEPWLEGERLLYRTLRVSLERKVPLGEDLPKARKLLGPQPAVEWLVGRYHAEHAHWPEAIAAYRGVTGLLTRNPLLGYELAQAFHRSGKLDEGLETLRRLHSRHLYSKASLELFRNLALQKGLAKEAEEAQAALREQFKDDPGVELAGGMMALASGNLTEAARVFDDLAFKNPADESAEAGRLTVLLAKKDYEGILRECSSGKAPVAILARFKALALIRLNRLDEAEETLARAIADRPDWILHLLQGNLLLSRNKTEPAARAYAAVLQAQPRSEVAHLGLATIAARGNRWREVVHEIRPLTDANVAVPIAYLLLGEAELNEGHPDRAATAAERVLTLTPEDPGGLLLRGAAILALGKPEEAEAQLLKCAATRPDDASIQWYLAQARIARGAYEDALTGVETSLARGSTGNLPLQLVRLVLLAQNGRASDARGLLERLVSQISPLQARLCEAWLFQREGQLPRAAEILRPSLDQRPAALLWAELMIRQGHPDGVIEVLDRHTLDSVLWSRLAEEARTNGLVGLTVDCCRRAVKFDPENASLLNNLAWFAVQLPSFDAAEAMAAARKAAALLPTNPAILHTSGTVLLKCGKERDCIDLLVRADATTQQSPKLMLVLGQAYEKSGNAEKALQWYSSCLNHPATAAEAQGELSRPALQQRIERLKPKSP